MSAFASLQDTDFSALDAKLESFGLNGGDFEVYAFDEYDGLGDQLEEQGDDFNQDTFGGDLPVTRDFDFGHSKQQQQQQQPHANVSQASNNIQPRSQAPASSSTASFLDSDALLGPARSKPLPWQQQQQQQAPLQAARPKTLEEIEAEMMRGQRQATSQQMPQQPPKPAYKTMEEIEAELLQKRQQQRQQEAAFSPPPSGTAHEQMPSLQAQLPAQGPVQKSTHPSSAHAGRPSMDVNQLLTQHMQLPAQQTQSSIPLQSLMQQNQRQGPPPPPQQRMHQSAMTLGQLHGLRGQLLSNPNQTPDIVAEVGRIEAIIMSIEREEKLRRRRMDKIFDMSHYNNVMWNSEKDFITRIQLSQLLNTAGPGGEHDPLKDDFYFTVFQHLRGVKAAALQNAQIAVQQGGQRGGKRKLLAVQKMAMQVQRIVEDARKKPRATQLSLDGALGKIALRSRSAPRQLLQVTPSSSATNISEQAGQPAATQKPALTRRQVLLALEKLYDIVLEVEQIKRLQPSQPNDAAEMDDAARAELEESKERYNKLLDQMWTTLCATEPLDISNPHPFISLLGPAKGKKLLPRILRHTSAQQSLTLFTLLLATFSQLDVVRDAPLLDMPPVNAPPQRESAAKEVDLFLSTIVPGFIGMLNRLPLRVLTGMFALLITRNPVHVLCTSKAGIAVLTVFMSRAQILMNQGMPTEEGESMEKPDANDLAAWTNAFNNLFAQMQTNMLRFFPSTRIAAALPFGASLYLAGPANSMLAEADAEDEAVWTFFAAVAVCADMNQQQLLVTELREKVLESVNAVAKKWVTPEIGERKIKNVNLLMHALGLDASQISV